MTFLALVALCLTGCKKERLTVSPASLWFPLEGGVQEIQLTSNCSWTLTFDDQTDWYSIESVNPIGQENDSTTTTLKGSGDATLAVTVRAMVEESSRSSSFTITSAKGDLKVGVRIAQNTTDIPELQSITNMIYGATTIGHWNTDFYGNVIEDSYRSYEFDPNDTTKGYFMYFFENGEGVQKDNGGDSTVYYRFTYEYDPVIRILHFDFETISDTLTEIYNAPVLLATEELFRFQHEYKPNFWERADMKKVGDISPQAKATLKKKAKKRSGDEPVFIF